MKMLDKTKRVPKDVN